tara:strand:- start:26 stop:202 length:177 start_codon:yes stop_codon:yes gene_type:complete
MKNKIEETFGITFVENESDENDLTIKTRSTADDFNDYFDEDQLNELIEELLLTPYTSH